MATHQTTEKTHSQNGGLTVSEMERREDAWRDDQPTTTRCAFCPWTFEGTAAAGREAAAEHRAAEHPAARKLTRKQREAAQHAVANERAAQIRERRNGPQNARAAVDEPPAPSTNGAAMTATADAPWWTRERIIQEIQRLNTENGKPPSFSTWPALGAAAAAMFGKWNAAVAAAGFEPRSANNAGGSTKTAAQNADDVLTAIRARAVDGVAPSSAADRSLTGRAVYYFGSWAKAVAAAGLLSMTEAAAEPEQASPGEPDPGPVEESHTEAATAPGDEREEEPQPDPDPDALPYFGRNAVYQGQPFAALAAELEDAFRAEQAAAARFAKAQEEFLKHPVFDYIWELYWPYDDDRHGRMTVEKLLLVATERLKQERAT